MKDLRIIFFGTSYFVIPVLEELSKNFSVAGVVTAPDAPSITSRQNPTPSPIKRAFYQFKLNKKGKIFTPDKLSSKYLDPELLKELKFLKPDLIVVSSYGKIIPQEIVDLPKFGSINIHPSLLPEFRGPTPVPAAILAGARVSGITVIKMDEQMDHGPIIYQEEYRLSDSDTAKDLLEKMWQKGAQLVTQVISDYVSGKIKPVSQNHAAATFCAMIKKEGGYFEIDNPPPPEILDRMIRAYYPWPTVWTNWKGKIVKFLPNKMMQMEGKKIIPLKDFLNGYPDFPIRQ